MNTEGKNIGLARTLVYPLNHNKIAWASSIKETAAKVNGDLKSNNNSCVVSSFLNVMQHTVMDKFDIGGYLNGFTKLVKEYSEFAEARQKQYQKHLKMQAYMEARVSLSEKYNSIWDHLVANKPTDYAPKGTVNAALGDIAELIAQTDYEKAITGFKTTVTCNACNASNEIIRGTVDLNVYNPGSSNTKWNDVFEADFSNVEHGNCLSCGMMGFLVVNSVTVPEIMIVGCSVTTDLADSLDQVHHIREEQYEVGGLVQHHGQHFIAIVKVNGQWQILDDMVSRNIEASSLEDALQYTRKTYGTFTDSLIAGVCMVTFIKTANQILPSSNNHVAGNISRPPISADSAKDTTGNITTQKALPSKSGYGIQARRNNTTAVSNSRSKNTTNPIRSATVPITQRSAVPAVALPTVLYRKQAHFDNFSPVSDSRPQYAAAPIDYASVSISSANVLPVVTRSNLPTQTFGSVARVQSFGTWKRRIHSHSTLTFATGSQHTTSLNASSSNVPSVIQQRRRNVSRALSFGPTSAVTENANHTNTGATTSNNTGFTQNRSAKRKSNRIEIFDGESDNVEDVVTQVKRAKQTANTNCSGMIDAVADVNDTVPNVFLPVPGPNVISPTHAGANVSIGHAVRNVTTRIIATEKEKKHRKRTRAAVCADNYKKKALKVLRSKFELDSTNGRIRAAMKEVNISVIVDDVVQKGLKYMKRVRNLHHPTTSEQIKTPIRVPCMCCKKMLYTEHRVMLSEFDGSKNTNHAAGVKVYDILCPRCLKQLRADKLPPQASNNKLNLTPIPTVLSTLSFLEKRFISMLQVYLTVLVLEGGQYATKGMAVHFTSEPSELQNTLPRAPDDDGVICESGKYLEVISPLKICAALLWLKRHNALYRYVSINHDVLRTTGKHKSLTNHIIEYGTIPIDFECAMSNVAQGKKKNLPTFAFPRSVTPPMQYDRVDNAEAMAFPWLLPTGNSDNTVNRRQKLTTLEYYRSRFAHEDKRFRCDLAYIMTAVNHYERQQLGRLCFFYAAVCKKTMNDKSEIITKSDLLLSDDNNNSNPSTTHNNPKAVSPKTMSFMSQMRGTAMYWRDMLYDLLTKMKCLGPPTLFVTLSVDDNNWPGLRKVLEEEEGHSIKGNLAQYVKKNPIVVAQYANRHFLKELRNIYKTKCLGTATDHHVRIEFQNRGSVHFHCFFWIKEFPSISDKSSATKLCQYIDSVISTELPDEQIDPELYKLVKTRQFHKHTATCKKRFSAKCRFNYPKELQAQTTVKYSHEMYVKAKTFYVTKRCKGCENLNNYNPSILRRWKANMDIQIVNGAYGVAYYVCKYIMKAEPQELQAKLLETIEHMKTQNLQKRVELFKLGVVVLKTRTMTAQEAAFRLMGIPMVQSSRTCVRLSTTTEALRVKRLKSTALLKELEETSSDIFMDNMIDVYRKRPYSLEGNSLFYVVSWYEKVNVKMTGKKLLSLLDNSCKLRKRTKFKCVRTTAVSMSSDDYYYSLLLLHYPHRTEKDLRSDCANYKNSFIKNNSKMNFDSISNQSYVDEVLEECRRIQVTNSLAQLSQTTNTLVQSIHLSPEDEALIESYGNAPDPSSDQVISAPSNMVSTSQSETNQWHALMTSTTNSNDLSTKLKQLSSDQKICLRYLKMQLDNKSQLQVVITGNAGTGKSFLLEVIGDFLRLNYSALPGSDPIVVGAPTGLAAKNVKGRTLHNLFRIPLLSRETNHAAMFPLTQVVKDTLAVQFAAKNFLLIDEISMVGAKLLESVNFRLQQIKQSHLPDNKRLPFGGMHVIACGDFHQLKPVLDNYCFLSPVFADFESVFLQENMRQKDDWAWCQLLDRLREGELTPDDHKVLSTRVVHHESDLDGVDIDMRLYPKLKQTAAFNISQQKLITSATIVIKASDRYSSDDAHPGLMANPNDIPTDDRLAGGLCTFLIASIGSRLMVTRNLCSDVVNGDMGVCRHFKRLPDGTVDIIYIEMDNKDSGHHLNDFVHTNCIPIVRTHVQYSAHGRCLARIQFPLTPCWAVTIHKAQGMSLNSAFVHIGPEIFARSMIYVALSRVRTLSGLYIDACDGHNYINVRKSILQPDDRVVTWTMGALHKWQQILTDMSNVSKET